MFVHTKNSLLKQFLAYSYTLYCGFTKYAFKMHNNFNIILYKIIKYNLRENEMIIMWDDDWHSTETPLFVDYKCDN